MFEKDEEGVYWCDASNIGIEEVFDQVSVWVENNLSLNQITILILEKIPEETELEVFIIPEIPEEQVGLEKGYYRCVYAMLWFQK